MKEAPDDMGVMQSCTEDRAVAMRGTLGIVGWWDIGDRRMVGLWGRWGGCGTRGWGY